VPNENYIAVFSCTPQIYIAIIGAYHGFDDPVGAGIKKSTSELLY
jgi:hypothetical protein